MKLQKIGVWLIITAVVLFNVLLVVAAIGWTYKFLLDVRSRDVFGFFSGWVAASCWVLSILVIGGESMLLVDVGCK